GEAKGDLTGRWPSCPPSCGLLGKTAGGGRQGRVAAPLTPGRGRRMMGGCASRRVLVLQLLAEGSAVIHFKQRRSGRWSFAGVLLLAALLGAGWAASTAVRAQDRDRQLEAFKAEAQARAQAEQAKQQAARAVLELEADVAADLARKAKEAAKAPLPPRHF